jgi:hypothetical protein
MGDLEHFVRSYLLADQRIIRAFGEPFKLSLVSHNVQTMTSKTQVMSRTYASYKIEGDECAIIGVIADANDIIRMDLFMLNGSTTPICLSQKQLEHDAKSFALADSKIRNEMGDKLSFKRLSFGSHGPESYSSFEVEGCKNVGVASVQTNQHGVRNIEIFLANKTVNVRVPNKSCLFAKSA